MEEVGGSSFFYGACISMYSFSKICVMPLVGIWSDRDRMIRPLICCLLFCILGNVLYASAQWLQSAWFILLGRCLIGIGSSSGVLSSSFITRVTTAETRTKVLTTINVLNMLALVLGPITNLVTTQVEFHTPIPGLSFNALTNPGWLMAFLMTLLLIVTLLTFEEPPRLPAALPPNVNGNTGRLSNPNRLSQSEVNAAEEEFLALDGRGSDQTRGEGETLREELGNRGSRSQAANGDSRREAVADARNGNVPGKESQENFLYVLRRMVMQHGIWVFFIVSWNNNFTLSGLETALPAVNRRMFDFNAFDNSLAYCVLGAIIGTAFVILKFFGDAFSDRALLLSGTTLFLLGSAFACISSPLNSDPEIFVIGLSMTPIIFAVPILAAPNVSLYTKTLEHLGGGAYIGGFMGILQTVSSISRMCSPLFTGFALTYRGVRLLFMLPMLFSAVTLFALAARWTKLRIPKAQQDGELLGEGLVDAEEPLLDAELGGQ